MTIEYIPPLAINFIWNAADSKIVNPILDNIRVYFSRDKDKPFSRGLNIPLFFFSSLNSQDIPSDYPQKLANNNIIFVFTSVNTVGKNAWRKYIDGLPQSSSVHIVPIAVDKNGYNHGGSLMGLNCIRIDDWPVDNQDLYAMVAIAHEVYRFSSDIFSSDDKGIKSSITLFLSHSKVSDIGIRYSEKIKQFIDNTNMNRFFDANEISPGYHFDLEIEKHIRNSTLLAIQSDTYSSRYWCQNEVLIAKRENRPVVVVNCSDDYEDRIFPATSNVPCIHISSTESICERDILRILSATILETIRFYNSLQFLEAYRRAGWIAADCEISARPPELRQVLNLKKSSKLKICYPEPPIYSIEADWHGALEIDAFTPLWSLSEQDSLATQRVGISISNVLNDDFSDHHIHDDHLVRLSQDLTRHLLARSAVLIYGGDLRPNGVTEFILEEARILRERLGEVTPHVENHLAWPLYVSDAEITSWRARYHQVMDTFEHDIPNDVVANIDKGTFLSPNTPRNSYIWSRCLTEMRQNSISSSTARICAGGMLSGFKGKMPGILEEIVLALKAQKPIFLLGAFGGVVGDVCKIILTGEVPETLTSAWQLDHNEGYSDLQELAGSYGHDCDYELIIKSIQKLSISDLTSHCSLDDNEYKRLMISPFVDECIYLVLKGLNEK